MISFGPINNFSYYSEYHLVANEHNLDHIYSSLCEGQSLNPDEEDMDQQDQGQIDLSGFTWAEGYGPEFLTGAPQVNGGGDATPNIAGLNVSYFDHPISVLKSLKSILIFSDWWNQSLPRWRKWSRIE